MAPHRLGRREFLGIGGGLAADRVPGRRSSRAPTVRPSPASGGVLRVEGPPDLVLLDGTIHTMDGSTPRARAFAVKDGRFVAVGASHDVRNLRGPNTRVIDGRGTTVVPGFIDCHLHASGLADLFEASLDVDTMGELRTRLADAAAATPAGVWVSGGLYQDGRVLDEEVGRRRPLTLRDLDRAVAHRPVRIAHRLGDRVWYNSRALELAGIDRHTPEPPGVRFGRDGEGELTGLVEGPAGLLFTGVARPRTYTREERRAGVAHITGRMAAAGLTSVHHAGAWRDDLVAFQDALEADALPLRIFVLVRGSAYRGLRAAGVRTGFGDGRLRIGSVKYTADGSASGGTMRVTEPHGGRDGDHGTLHLDQEELNDLVEEAHRAGWQVGIHANGDAAIDMVLTAYERARRNWPREDPRHRIEHCSLVNPDLLRRIRAGGYVPTPFWTYVHFHGDRWHAYGEERMEWMFAHRSFLDHDVPVPGASDYRPGPYEPLMAIQSMVTRTDRQGTAWGPGQRVSVEEALRIGTIHGARASFEESLKGSITPGKLADFVVLDRDPHDVDPHAIMEIGVIRSVVGGRTVHQS